MDKLIIGISGKKQSGKNTFANQVIVASDRSYWADYHVGDDGRLVNATHHSVCGDDAVDAIAQACDIRILSFAEAIKKFCTEVFGLTHEQCYGTDEQKNSLTGIKRPGTDTYMTAREVMQFFGTDMMRAWIPNVWVDACIRTATNSEESIVLIPDVRFPNEAQAIRDIGGKLVRLTRNVCNDLHASETALDDWTDWDLVVPDCDGVKAQGDYIRPTIEKWLDELSAVRVDDLGR